MTDDRITVEIHADVSGFHAAMRQASRAAHQAQRRLDVEPITTPAPRSLRLVLAEGQPRASIHRWPRLPPPHPQPEEAPMTRWNARWTPTSFAPGPQRVEHDPDPDVVRRPIGFLADLAVTGPSEPVTSPPACVTQDPATVTDPLLWDGDQA